MPPEQTSEKYQPEEEEKIPDAVLAHMQIDDEPEDTVTKIKNHFAATESSIIEKELSELNHQHLTFYEDLAGAYSDAPDKSMNEDRTEEAHNDRVAEEVQD